MNVRGIERLRLYGLPGPKKETIHRDPSTIDLDDLFDGAFRDATILVFDYREPIDQPQMKEKNVRQYNVAREGFFSVLERKACEMMSKDVPADALRYLVHQSYGDFNIDWSGRIHIDRRIHRLSIDGAANQREADTDFEPSFRYSVPIFGDRVLRSREEILGDVPSSLVGRILKGVRKIPDNPLIDFEVYTSGELFYHDMSLT